MYENMFSLSSNYSIKEVIHSSVISYVSVNNIKDIVYIFHVLNVNNGRYKILGKENAYFIRFEEGNKFK